MFNKIIKTLVAIAAAAVLSGFGAGTPIYNVTSAPIPPSPLATPENLQKAIMRAGLTLGWQMTPRGPNQVEAVLNIRRHQAIVDITHDEKSFSILYRTSTNLDYVEQDRTIHSNYNGWIRNLEKAIRAQVTVL